MDTRPRLRPVLAACLAALALGAGAPVAHAEDAAPTGAPCSFESIAPEGGDTYTGVLFGGPVLAPGSTVTLRCSIHVGNDVHSGPAAVTESSGPGDGLAVLDPRQFTLTLPEDERVETCTEATVGSTTWYWTETGEWTTDPAATCGGLREWVLLTPYWTLPPVLRPAYVYALTIFWCVSPVQWRSTCDVIGGAIEVVEGLLP